MSGFVRIAAAMVAILAVTGMLLAYKIRKKGKGKVEQETDYRALFRMGTIFFPVGLAWMIVCILVGISFTIALPFLCLGVIHLSVGLASRDRWKKNEEPL